MAIGLMSARLVSGQLPDGLQLLFLQHDQFGQMALDLSQHGGIGGGFYGGSHRKLSD